ncbi:cytochrome P450 2J6-like [Thamnophis elegans]|uniref:cytochrome P450 2J6-like n=1 Tax=Thamnophis elegans TaxID=35005 RepID=UPI0013780F44|nr:cytochrome P450 2J6-like [Thamnophis elegans]
MTHKGGIEGLNRTLQDITGSNHLMDGVTVLLAGYLEQTLPIVPQGTYADEVEVKACLKSSILWPNVKVLSLRVNMYVHLQRLKMEVSQFLIATGICFLLVQFAILLWTRRKFPPGPVPFPLFGSLWRTGWKIRQDTFMKLIDTYGNVFTFWIGHTPVIVLTGFKAVKIGLVTNSEVMCERPIFPFSKILGGGKGIMFSNGKTWRQQRQFGNMTLQKLGDMKKSLEEHIQEETTRLVKTFAQAKGQPLDPSLLIMHSATQMIHTAVFGEPVLKVDDMFQNLVEHISNITKCRGTFGEMIYNIFPSLVEYLPGPHKKANSSFEFMISYIKKKMGNSKYSQASHEPQSYVDFYLAHMDNEKKDSTSTFQEENLVQVIVDLFLAGTDTIAVTLSWALFFMGVHPNIQEKVQEEIQNALDPQKPICYEDRKKLPYTYAVLHEAQRLSSITLSTLFRLCAIDLNVLEFYIPKGSLVIPDLCSVLLDPKQWEVPRQFNPNHFLDQDGKFVPREDFLIFGTGSRECLGKTLAQMELFIFFTNLMKTFTFQRPEELKAFNMEDVIEAGMQLSPLKICAVPR